MADDNDYRHEEKMRALASIVCIVIAVLAALGAAVCVALYIAYKNDIMFIPIALCAVVAMISFTYYRVKR